MFRAKAQPPMFRSIMSRLHSIEHIILAEPLPATLDAASKLEQKSSARAGAQSFGQLATSPASVGNGPETVVEEEGDSDVAKGTEEEIKGEKDITKGEEEEIKGEDEATKALEDSRKGKLNKAET